MVCISILLPVELDASSRIDSLEHNLANIDQMERIPVLEELAKHYLKKSPEKSMDFLWQAVGIAKNLRLNKESSEIHWAMARVHLSQKNMDSALFYTRASLIYAKRDNNQEELSKIYNNIGIIYFQMKNFDSALVYYGFSLEIRKGLEDYKSIVKSYTNIANLHMAQNKYDPAVNAYRELLKYAKEENDGRKIIECYYIISTLYIRKNEYYMALEFCYKELKAREKYDMHDDIDVTFFNIGRIHHALKKYVDAFKNYEDARQMALDKGKIKMAANYSISIGNAYSEIGDYSKALIYYNEALEVVKKGSNSDMHAALLNNIGLTYKYMGIYDKALKYCKESFELKETSGDKSVFYPLTSLAEINLKLGRYDDAIKNFERGLEIAFNENDNKMRKESYRRLYESHKLNGNYSRALKYNELFHALNDSINNVEVIAKLDEARVKHETEKKDQENRQLAETNQLQRNYFIVIIILILVIAVVIYSRFHAKKKANKILQDKNNQIEQQSRNLEYTLAQLQIKEETLTEANATKDKFFSIIAHDLKNPLQAIILSSDVLINKFKYMDGMQLIDLIKTINKAGNHLTNLLENLLQWSRSQTGKIEYDPVRVDLQFIASKNLDLFHANALKKNIAMSYEFPTGKYVNADPNMLDTVFRNLLSNAIKFTPDDGRIVITSKRLNGMVEISVTDTGLGISKEDIDKLFRIDVHHTTVGTSKEYGTGLGLILCKEFIEKHGGTIRVESELGNGSSFKFTLPAENV